MNITPTLVSKLNTVLQVSLAALSLASPVFDFAGHPALTGLCFLTGGTTIYSGLQYIGGDAMRPVKRSNKK
uniref:Uncharacterized protein n=1 Tax=Acrobeloides nanus TaxID=290746 RepID=A0A914D370_9BILA